jgi:putative transposase
MMRKALKYRLYPTKHQATLLQEQLDECRWLYNKLLEERRDSWEQRQEGLSYFKQCKRITELKSERPTLKIVYSQVLQNVADRLDKGFHGFFRRVKAGENKPGYPRFKNYDRYDSFTYTQFGFAIKESNLNLTRIGDIKIILHRPISGKIKTCSIIKSAAKWYVCFAVESTSEPLPESDTAIGIDVGLTSFATLSTGKKIPNPRFFKTDEKALAKSQRKMSKLDKGTLERRRVKKVVSRIHERIANRRHDFAHQETRKLVNEFGIIAVEKLQIKEMMDGNWRSMNRGIGDVAWAQFRHCIQYKAEDAGRMYVEVNPRGTTQRCSRCQSIVPKDLSVCIHSCPICGLVLDRDLNASFNILALGLQSLGKIPRSPAL